MKYAQLRSKIYHEFFVTLKFCIKFAIADRLEAPVGG